MTDIQTRNTQFEGAMPRREFIRKSLIASGGVFVGMTTLGNVSLPELSSSKNPKKPASGKASTSSGTTSIDEGGSTKPGWTSRG